ncbi:hypothetical protein TMPK1_29400 [Rhodospirillales bacterium TMPK1]|uniref:Apea-like HEPN domain-containing protein n=2 Tax=Roseiterribacter gracilis TaxID=2812848 RepID=A0A8S8XB58_9PROT|nr:hypothetical protein TMPK1_29400 [Rhodospirillales bacterium TMPK1]
MDKQQRGELQKLATIYVDAFREAAVQGRDDVARILRSPGWTLHELGAIEHTPELVQALADLSQRAAEYLGATKGNESAIRKIAEQCAFELKDESNPEVLTSGIDRLIDTILTRATTVIEGIYPNYLFHLAGADVSIGPVRATTTQRFDQELRERPEGELVRLVPGKRLTYTEFPEPGDAWTFTIHPVCWVVSIVGAPENADEEAKWLIDVAVSYLRLLVPERGPLFPKIGDVEPHPFFPHHEKAGIKLTCTAASFGKVSLPPTYSITPLIQRAIATDSFKANADAIFNARPKSLGEQIGRGLGWLARGRQAADRAERFLYFFTAIEAVLTRDDKTSPVVQTIARHAAVMLTDDNGGRAELASLLRKLYSNRSALIHGGDPSVIWTSANTLQQIAESIFFLLVRTPDLARKHESFCDELARATYGLPWSGRPQI